MSLQTYLETLQQYEQKRKRQSVDLLSSIISNILRSPLNTEYHKVDASIFAKYPICIKILNKAGFIHSKNGKKLLFKIDNIKHLKKVNKALKNQFDIKQSTHHSTKIIDDEKKTAANNTSKNTQTIGESLELDRLYNKYHPKLSLVCIIDECECLKRITSILNKYHSYIHQNCSMFENQVQNNDSQYGTIDSIYEKDYDNVKLLNDYHHLLYQHSHQFEDIHMKLVKNANRNQWCKLSCYMLQRNHRDRANLGDRRDELNKMYFNNDDHGIILQQYLDTIHSYYFHSIDTGFRITKLDRDELEQHFMNEYDNIDDDKYVSVCNDATQTITALIKSKKPNYENMEGLNRLKINNNDKFQTVLTEDTEEKKDDTITVAPYYSFGYRYFYWDYYKNNVSLIDDIVKDPQQTQWNEPANIGYRVCDWYIYPRFINLKEEMLQNPICCIGEGQWKEHLMKAQDYEKTDRALILHCRQIGNVPTFNIYGIPFHTDTEHGIPVPLECFVAMKIYCNQDVLQNRFTATYRKNSLNESDKSLKQRHSNYYHLGRLLRELVECFGHYKGPLDGSKITNDKIMQQTANINEFWAGNLFHGISCDVRFASSYVQFKGPTSTTTDYAVAVNYCGNTGIIIELQLGVYWKYDEDVMTSPYFDCQFLSDYTNEQERFFIGGARKFTVITMIEAAGDNYAHYCKALRELFRALSGIIGIGKLFHSLQNMVFRLLSHEMHRYYPNGDKCHEYKSAPKRAINLLHDHFQNIDVVRFNELNNKRSRMIPIRPQNNLVLESIKHLDYKCKLLRHFFFHQDGTLKLDVLTTIFPSLQRIFVDFIDDSLNMAIVENDNFYKSILKLIKSSQELKLNHIEITLTFNNVTMVLLSDMIKKYDEKFKTYGWIMCRITKSIKGFDWCTVNKYEHMSDDQLQDMRQTEKLIRFCIEKQVTPQPHSKRQELQRLRQQLQALKNSGNNILTNNDYQ